MYCKKGGSKGGSVKRPNMNISGGASIKGGATIPSIPKPSPGPPSTGGVMNISAGGGGGGTIPDVVPSRPVVPDVVPTYEAPELISNPITPAPVNIMPTPAPVEVIPQAPVNIMPTAPAPIIPDPVY